MKQHSCDLITGEITLDYLAGRQAAGWKITSIDWVREVGEQETNPAHGDTAPPAVLADTPTAIPYGLRLNEDGLGLEEDPTETGVLILTLQQIVRERRIMEIAHQLNLAGYTTRAGGTWNEIAVFNLLPRLVEVGPAVLKSQLWLDR